jgi:uncharacterized integral membrane protein
MTQRRITRWIRKRFCDPPPTVLPWLDDPSQELNDQAAKVLRARVMPSGGNATEIVFEGTCPRCRHPTVSTHPVRSVVTTTPEAVGDAESLRLPAGLPAGAEIKSRRVTAQCRCSHVHSDRPASELGCGAPFALWVIWSASGDAAKDRAATVAPARGTSLLELEEDKDLQHAAEGQLASVRKAAESWRTGLGALLTILTVVFFVKGKDSFDDIKAGAWRWWLAVTLLAAVLLAVNGAYRALRAAYGAPRDEYVGRASFALAQLPRWLRTTPGEMDEYGTLSAWRHAFAVQAVKDLWWAKASTVASLLMVAAAATITWTAPGPPPPAFAQVTYTLGGKPHAVCGELKRGFDGRFAIKDSAGKTTPFAFGDLKSLRIVAKCG